MNTSLPTGYDLDRCPLGTYRWRFTVNDKAPKGQRPGATLEEARQAAWDHWTKTNNTASRAIPCVVHD